MARKVLLITGDGGESYETLYALHRFQEESFFVDLAAPSKRRLHLVIHDFEPGWDTYIERPGYGVEASLSIADVQPDSYEAILLLGGRAPEYLRNQASLLDLVKTFERGGKWIFSICHGIQVLVAAGVTKGRTVTCYEHVRPEVELSGGTWVADQATRDGNIVSAQTWQSHPDFYRLIFECLRTPAAA